MHAGPRKQPPGPRLVLHQVNAAQKRDLANHARRGFVPTKDQSVPFFDDFRASRAQILHVFVHGVRDEPDQDGHNRDADENRDKEGEALGRFKDGTIVSACDEYLENHKHGTPAVVGQLMVAVVSSHEHPDYRKRNTADETDEKEDVETDGWVCRDRVLQLVHEVVRAVECGVAVAVEQLRVVRALLGLLRGLGEVRLHGVGTAQETEQVDRDFETRENGRAGGWSLRLHRRRLQQLCLTRAALCWIGAHTC
mmetsp:Transcript_13260/g.26113  ORF Transcript_13260/g.26113 Transcript_13260/m.26113 type:complete len:252 (+) Transcript_13260:2024-2779(+)